MSNIITEQWNNALSFLKEETTDISYKTWIEPLCPSHVQGNIFIIEAPSDLHKQTIDTRFKDLVKNSINFANNTEYDVDIVLESNNSANRTESISEDSSADNRNNDFVPIFNEKYTFDNFVVGKNNFLAHAAAVAVAEAPAQSHNPLFIYGGSGLGKTHLLQAIGQYILQNNKGKKVLYVTSEKYTIELINAIKNTRNSNTMDQFRKKYRDVDVLIIDDIQFISKKDGVQEEFFHTFDALYQDNKQIVISCDQSPKDIDLLSERLRTRFGWGLTADIQKPDLETRAAILKSRIEDEKIMIPDDVILYIANNVKTSIRDLEGALNRVIAFSSLTDRELNVEIAQEALKDIISAYHPIINCETIINIVSRYYDIRIDDIKSTKKSSRISYPRQIAMYLCRNFTESTLIEIGQAFGRDHATIIHGVSKIEKDLEKNMQTNKDIEELKKTILHG